MLKLAGLSDAINRSIRSWGTHRGAAAATAEDLQQKLPDPAANHSEFGAGNLRQ